MGSQKGDASTVIPKQLACHGRFVPSSARTLGTPFLCKTSQGSGAAYSVCMEIIEQFFCIAGFSLAIAGLMRQIM